MQSEVPEMPLSDQEELYNHLRSQAELYHQLEERFGPPKVGRPHLDPVPYAARHPPTASFMDLAEY